MKKSLLPLVHDDSEILIVGTMPGEKSLAVQQYYGNRGNYFWKIIYTVFEEDFSLDYEHRKQLLRKKKIALWNVLDYCERVGSQDSNIRNEIANNFDIFFRKYPRIKYVFFESKAAAKYYRKFTLPENDLNFGILPSTSGLNARLSFEEKLSEWQKLSSLCA